MSEQEETPVRVDCTDCPFSRVVDPDDDVEPADVIVEHGRETGHTVVPSPLDD